MPSFDEGLNVGDILSLLKGEFPHLEYVGPPDASVRGFSDPGDYRRGTAIWLGDRKYLNLPEGQESEVALLFCAPGMAGRERFPATVLCADPRNAFMRLVELACPVDLEQGIHPTAVIDPSATIGEGVFVGPHAVVEADAVVGKGSRLHAGCVVRSGVRIGERCVIGGNAVIGNAGYGFRENGGLVRLPHLGTAILGDDVEVGSCSVVDRGTFKDTLIGNGSKLDSMTNVGHNATVGRNCLVIGGCVGGNSSVGDDCELVHVLMKNRVRIGNGVRAGMGSVILQDIPDGCTCFGNPARIIRKG